MSTLVEIEKAIESLPDLEVDELASWLHQRRRERTGWPVPPPDVPLEELKQIEAVIEEAFPTLRS